VVNKNTVPFETRSPFKASGIRFGTPGVTTRGLGPDDMATIADWVERILTSKGDAATIETVRGEVAEMTRKHPVPNSTEG
jgi:glycine hydroxymethyltransferase